MKTVSVILDKSMFRKLKSDYVNLYDTYEFTNTMYDKILRASRNSIWENEERALIPHVWAFKNLLKIKADELDENGEEVYVYSIVSSYDSANKVSRDTNFYVPAARNFPPEMFEEVGANMFELIVSEEELIEWAEGKVKILTSSLDVLQKV